MFASAKIPHFNVSNSSRPQFHKKENELVFQQTCEQQCNVKWVHNRAKTTDVAAARVLDAFSGAA